MNFKTKKQNWRACQKMLWQKKIMGEKSIDKIETLLPRIWRSCIIYVALTRRDFLIKICAGIVALHV